ncbi:nucleotidyltransferase domain-containing protein [Salinicola sp. LHM]|jgi:type I restriction enzyme R subunit|uniref:nucleotidyltransferase family protein n=1 Tax=Salinicola TaxID=404432 RepID=UPI00211B02D9|nr:MULTISPECIES: nucleotidyltransferase domain-containing protein [Salinicola]WQH34177.1 nucleotidyltransferase domain-containing protein [Salinicola sp. LHM]
MFGLPESAIEAIRRVLAECPGIEKVVIYGSRAKGTFRPGSDIDLALYGDISDDDLSALMNRLDELNTPYLFDIVRYRDIDNEALRDHIIRVGQRFDESHSPRSPG